MFRHQYFDLLLHEDSELSRILAEPIVERSTLHEWPLSCVQRVTTESGKRVIYKATSGPSMETVFSAAAHSPLLIPARTIYQTRGYCCLLMEYIDAPLLLSHSVDRVTLREMAVDLARQIDRIEGDLPYYLNIEGGDRWQSFCFRVLGALRGLVCDGLFSAVTAEKISQLERVMYAKVAEAAVDGRQAYLHGDLTPDNIFVTERGLRVIDWQRPLRGPARLDQVQLLEAVGLEATDYEEIGAALIGICLRIYWFTACTLRWFPAGRDTYDSSIAALIDKASELMRDAE